MGGWATPGLVRLNSDKVPDAILEEIKGVLKGKKFQFPKTMVRALLRESEDLADLVGPGGGVIVSGDSHLSVL